MEIDEFNIPVPWGHVAVKAWGKRENEMILCFHGLQDNAGSFDFLVPQLPESFYYVCIDLPGHGKSSYFPPHLPINSMNFVYVYKLICDYLKRDKYIIIAHSYGAQISFVFSQLYPHHVKKFVLLDAVHFFPIYPDALDNFVSAFQKLNSLRPDAQPTYTYDELLKRFTESRRYGQITPEVAKVLMERSLIKVDDNKYRISTDQRLKYFINPMWTKDYVQKALQYYPIKCPTLMILAQQSLEYIRKMFDLDKFDWPIIKVVEGNHDVHMLHPERVSGIIKDFLLDFKSNL